MPKWSRCPRSVPRYMEDDWRDVEGFPWCELKANRGLYLTYDSIAGTLKLRRTRMGLRAIIGCGPHVLRNPLIPER